MINAKLKSRRGATLVFALVALAVAVVVCAVVIYAAQSNAGRVRSAQAAQQAQLTLNSAASALREEFAGTSMELANTYTTVTTVTNGVPSPDVQPGIVKVSYRKDDGEGHKTLLATGTYSNSGSFVPTAGSLSGLRSTLLDWVMLVMTDKATTKNDCYATYLIRSNGPDGPLEDVSVKIRLEPGATMDLTTQDERQVHDAEKYYLTAVLSMASTPSETITMTFMASVQENTSSTLISKTSQSIPNDTGIPTTISVTTIETKESLTLTWPEANTVVNVANKKGGI